MPTSTQICNLALAKLGDSAQVSSIIPPDGSMQAQYCALFYPQAVNVMLDKHPWTFAVATATLTALASNPNPFWLYAYGLPADFLGILDVRDPSFVEQFQQPHTQNFSLEGQILYSNLPAAVLVYTSNLATDPTVYPPLFVEALATLLAVYLAGPLLKGDVGAAAAQKLGEVFTGAFKEAAESDGQYRHITPVFMPYAIKARGSNGGLPGAGWANMGPLVGS